MVTKSLAGILAILSIAASVSLAAGDPKVFCNASTDLSAIDFQRMGKGEDNKQQSPVFIEAVLCEGILQHNPSACSIFGSQSMYCQKAYETLLSEMTSSFDSLQACKNWAGQNSELKQDKVGDFCKLYLGVLQGKVSRPDFCDEASEYLVKDREKAIEDCRTRFVFLDPACAPFKAWSHREWICSQIKMVSQVKKTKSAKACGGSSFCQALAENKPAICAGLKKEAIHLYCDAMEGDRNDGEIPSNTANPE